MNTRPYDYRNCQSLFGYAVAVHERSGGVCQLCGAGGGPGVEFDFWRQLTVEHLIGERQGGYLKPIRSAVAQRFHQLPAREQQNISKAIDEWNTISACSFCNSTTSRDSVPADLTDLILNTPGDPETVLEAVKLAVASVLVKKRADVAWKLAAIREAYSRQVAPALARVRAASESVS